MVGGSDLMRIGGRSLAYHPKYYWFLITITGGHAWTGERIRIGVRERRQKRERKGKCAAAG